MKHRVLVLLIVISVSLCAASEGMKLPRVLGVTLGGPIAAVENQYLKEGAQPLHRDGGSITYDTLLAPFKDGQVVMVSYLHSLGRLYEIRVFYNNKDIFLDLFMKLNPKYGNQHVITGASAILKGEIRWAENDMEILLRKLRDGDSGATILTYNYIYNEPDENPETDPIH